MVGQADMRIVSSAGNTNLWFMYRRRIVCCVVSNCALLYLSHLRAQKLQTHMHTTRHPYTRAYGPTIHTPTNTHVLLGTHIFFHRMMDTMMRTMKLNVQIPTPIKFSTSSRTLLWWGICSKRSQRGLQRVPLSTRMKSSRHWISDVFLWIEMLSIPFIGVPKSCKN